MQMATSIQARQPAASPLDSISNTTTTANSTQIKRVVKPTLRSASSHTNKVSSSDQHKHVPKYLNPTKSSPSHESFRYVKKDGQNERNSATQNHKAVVSSGPTRKGTTRTARRTSPSPGAKTAASSSEKPGQERVSKASKPGKIHQVYVKKTTLLSNGKETRDPAGSTEISKGVAIDPVSHEDNQETEQEETFVKETKKAEPAVEEVAIPTETVVETENVLVDVSVSEENEEERSKLQISDISTVSGEEENQSPSAVEPSESLAEKDEVAHDGNAAMRSEKDKREGEELEETKDGDKKEKIRVESEVEEIEKKEEEHGNSRDDGEERKGEEEKMKMVNLGSSGGGKGKKESPSAYNDVIEETASKLLEERKNKVKALVGAFETVIDYESSK